MRWLGPLFCMGVLLSACSSNRRAQQPANSLLTREQAEERLWQSMWVRAKADEIRKYASDGVRPVTLFQGEESVSGKPFYRFWFAESHPTHMCTIARILVGRSKGDILFKRFGAEGGLLATPEWEEYLRKLPNVD